MEANTSGQYRPNWIGLGEAAQLLNCTREAVRQLCHSGTLGYRRDRPFGVGGWSRLMVQRAAVERLLADEGFARRRR